MESFKPKTLNSNLYLRTPAPLLTAFGVKCRHTGLQFRDLQHLLIPKGSRCITTQGLELRAWAPRAMTYRSSKFPFRPSDACGPSVVVRVSHNESSEILSNRIRIACGEARRVQFSHYHKLVQDHATVFVPKTQAPNPFTRKPGP